MREDRRHCTYFVNFAVNGIGTNLPAALCAAMRAGSVVIFAENYSEYAVQRGSVMLLKMNGALRY